MGGVFWSRFVDYTIYAPGNNNKFLITNGGTLDLLSLFNQTILNVVERFEDVVISSINRTIIINVMLILIVIIFSILFLCLRQHCQKKPPEKIPTTFNLAFLLYLQQLMANSCRRTIPFMLKEILFRSCCTFFEK